MKVLCIRKDGWYLDGDPNKPWKNGPQFNEVCNVVDQDPTDYVLAGYDKTPAGYTVWFDKEYFIPLSDIDETELIEERLKEEVHG